MVNAVGRRALREWRYVAFLWYFFIALVLVVVAIDGLTRRSEERVFFLSLH